MENKIVKKIGILGGTFNPIHYGHLLIGEYTAKEYQLDQILVMPNHLPAYKDTTELIAKDHREKMIKTAISDNSLFQYSDLELKREGITYTADTMCILHDLYGKNTEIYFIMGADSLSNFLSWREPGKILSYCSLIVTKRGTGDLDTRDKDRENVLNKFPDGKIYLSECPYYELSSHNIRNRLKNYESIRYMVPDTIISYINENGLYQ